MNKLFAPFLPPWVETGLQPAFYDMESGTVLQQTARMYAKVQQLTRLFNELSEETKTTVEEYISKFVELKTFVDDYFENLDVQDEINNKLDQMAEDGTLQEIIGQYLDATTFWGFTSVADMKDGSNLVDGSYAKTTGYYSNNDGGAGNYRIRTRTFDDVDDGGSVIIMTDNTLVAELIVDNNINIRQFGAKGDDSTDDTTSIQNAINYAQTNEKELFINSGTYLVDGLTISNTITVKGESYNAVLKAIDTATSDILTITGAGAFKSELSGFAVDGNKDNVTSPINGLKITKGTAVAGDKYTNIHDISIYNLTGCGVYANEASAGDLRELRFRNVDIRGCEETGMYLNNVTDSYYDTVVCHANTKYGFDINSGPHKMTNCKAFYNGIGDGTTLEDANRVPASAFTVTADTYPHVGKTYYTRSGSNLQNDWYIFTEFSGDTFDGGTTYYELTTPYYKKYAGFYIHGVGFQLSNCESQENFGDGFRLGGSNYVIDSTIVDNNGNLATSYASAGIEQLYYGFYGGLWQSSISASARNFRQSSVGKQQKASAFLNGASEVNVSMTALNQVYGDVMLQNCTLEKVSILNNGYPQQMRFNTNNLTRVPTTLTWTSLRNYLVRQDQVVYLHFELKDTAGFANSTNSKSLITGIPEAYRPSKDMIFRGQLYGSGNGGWQLNKGECTVTLTHSGNLSCRANNSNETSDGDALSITLVYPVKGGNQS